MTDVESDIIETPLIGTKNLYSRAYNNEMPLKKE